jgi:hypothetical protein
MRRNELSPFSLILIPFIPPLLERLLSLRKSQAPWFVIFLAQAVTGSISEPKPLLRQKEPGNFPRLLDSPTFLMYYSEIMLRALQGGPRALETEVG